MKRAVKAAFIVEDNDHLANSDTEALVNTSWLTLIERNRDMTPEVVDALYQI